MQQVNQHQVTLLHTVIRFLAQRDIASLTSSALLSKYKATQADLLILLGSSSLQVAETAAKAYKSGLARELMICGGIGHSTHFLEENIRNHPVYRHIPVGERPEADMLADLLVNYLGVPASTLIIENKSTNCGDNAKQARQVLSGLQKAPKTILLLQDPVLQRRSKASFELVWQQEVGVQFISYATFVPELALAHHKIVYADEAHNEFCSIDRLLSLLMGEIPRLRNDADGYGPNGKGFITAVDIPEDVETAYQELVQVFTEYVRQ
ncbi:YdcF family protein [Pontibacter chitinilyticus]|uniref:YdcF family protein n=1 Tax=Pontibacter chitinilyticus TaxID=2674989 RepID=UPI003219B79C